MDTATVVISLELELEWGFHDLPTPSHVSSGATAEREALASLLDTCERHDVALTFDVVGHLFHEDCTGEHDSPHPPDWFAADPGSDLRTDPGYYAPDMIRAIAETNVSHEICSHTYSHALCDEIDAETLAWELDRVYELFDAFELPAPRSFVPPRQRPPNRTVLKRYGFDVLRVVSPEFERPQYGPVRKFLWLLFRGTPMGESRVADGIVETYCSPYPSLSAPYLRNGRDRPHPVFRALPKRLRRELHRRQLRRALETAIGEGSTLHLWTHLQNLANEEQLPQVLAFIEELARREAAGDIEILTMGDLGARMQGPRPTPP
jgi:peptidoglycan/xylan/chitin deacetylase (PgdA/CDA1 family)